MMPAAIGMKFEQFQRHITGKFSGSLFVTGGQFLLAIVHVCHGEKQHGEEQGLRQAVALTCCSLPFLGQLTFTSYASSPHSFRFLPLPVSIVFSITISLQVVIFQQPAVCGRCYIYLALAFLFTGLPSHAEERFDVTAAVLRFL